MKYLFTILLFLPFIIKAQIPTANAGSDQTIYLTQGNSVTLTGTATNRSASFWREVSTNYSSGATINSPNNLTTTVTGLSQGVFYFELAVTSPTDIVAVDTVKVTVNYTTVPQNSTLLFNFNLADTNIVKTINDRHDTTSYFPVTDHTYGQVTDANNHTWFLFRDRLNGLYIDPQRGKLISTIQDGYGHMNDGNGYYSRSEISLADYDFKIDTSKIYCFEWKGFLPQDTNYINTNGAPNWATILTMFQIHSLSQTPTVFGMNEGVKGNIYAGFQTDSLTLGYIPDFYNKARTLRFTIKEGQGQGAFMKVQLDGQTVYYLKNTAIGSGFYDDYVKFAGLYDWNNWIADPDSLSRGRKYSLVTEGFNVYQLSDTTASNIAPTANAGADQTITLPTNSVTLSGSGTDVDGTITSYLWEKTSGGIGTITNSSLSSTSVTGLDKGDYIFKLTVTDNSGATGTSNVKVTVNSLNISYKGKINFINQ